MCRAQGASDDAQTLISGKRAPHAQERASWLDVCPIALSAEQRIEIHSALREGVSLTPKDGQPVLRR